jgi:hypothetical protein
MSGSMLPDAPPSRPCWSCRGSRWPAHASRASSGPVRWFGMVSNPVRWVTRRITRRIGRFGADDARHATYAGNLFVLTRSPEAYFRARNQFFKDDLYQRRQGEHAYRVLTMDGNSPWRKYPWNLIWLAASRFRMPRIRRPSFSYGRIPECTRGALHEN